MYKTLSSLACLTFALVYSELAGFRLQINNGKQYPG